MHIALCSLEKQEARVSSKETVACLRLRQELRMTIFSDGLVAWCRMPLAQHHLVRWCMCRFRTHCPGNKSLAVIRLQATLGHSGCLSTRYETINFGLYPVIVVCSDMPAVLAVALIQLVVAAIGWAPSLVQSRKHLSPWRSMGRHGCRQTRDAPR